MHTISKSQVMEKIIILIANNVNILSMVRHCKSYQYKAGAVQK